MDYIKVNIVNNINEIILQPNKEPNSKYHKINLIGFTIYHEYIKNHHKQTYLTNDSEIKKIHQNLRGFFLAYCDYCQNINDDCDAYECLKVICSCIYIVTLPSELNELKQFEELLITSIK